MNNLLSNAPGNDLPVVSIVIALFLLVTVYYALLLSAFKMPFKKLIVSYAIIIVLLILILLISRYYFTFFGTYETFIADYKYKGNSNETNNNNNIKNDTHTPEHLTLTQSPFAPIYDVDKMCENATKSEIDRNDIGWKCRIRDEFGQDSFSLKTSANEAGKEASVQYDLKYDGVFDLKNK
jgi:hypothetical protein